MKNKRKWYKKKRFIIPIILYLVLYLNFPETIMILSIPLFAFIAIYLTFSLLGFWYCLITGKNPMDW